MGQMTPILSHVKRKAGTGEKGIDTVSPLW
jgi:hypothetical protein